MTKQQLNLNEIIKVVSGGITRILNKLKKTKWNKIKDFIKGQFKISSRIQDLLLIIIGVILVLIAETLYTYDDSFIFAFIDITGILLVFLGTIEFIFETVKGQALSSSSFISRLISIRFYIKLSKWILSFIIKESKRAKGLSLLTLIISFILGMFAGAVLIVVYILKQPY